MSNFKWQPILHLYPVLSLFIKNELINGNNLHMDLIQRLHTNKIQNVNNDLQ